MSETLETTSEHPPVDAASTPAVPATPAPAEPEATPPAPVAEVLPEVATEPEPTAELPHRTVRVPMVPTGGYVPTSLAVSLSGKAAQALADLTAGHAAASGLPHVDHNRALNTLLEQLAGD